MIAPIVLILLSVLSDPRAEQAELICRRAPFSRDPVEEYHQALRLVDDGSSPDAVRLFKAINEELEQVSRSIRGDGDRALREGDLRRARARYYEAARTAPFSESAKDAYLATVLRTSPDLLGRVKTAIDVESDYLWWIEKSADLESKFEKSERFKPRRARFRPGDFPRPGSTLSSEGR